MLAVTAPATAQKKPESAPPVTEQRRSQLLTQQQRLTVELGKLKRQLAASEASYGEAADALAASEAAISVTNRRLRELGEARANVEKQWLALRARQSRVYGEETAARLFLDELLRREHALSFADPLARFIAGDDPGDAARESEYLGYLSRATAEGIEELRARRLELSELEEKTASKRAELALIAEEENAAALRLTAEQAQRKRTFERLRRQISAQRQSIGKLERDEKRLSSLVNELSRVLAEQARRDVEQKARESQQARNRRDLQARRSPAEPRSSESLPPLTGSGFAQRRGRLPMPADGVISAHFGSARKVEGAGAAPTWKGVFIRAPQGADVRAVAPGQVVFADWLRGFGNLLVIDHGEEYLSIYGNNESLLRNIGDQVAVGDTVASVGATGGNAETGLYFELRFQGRPFDPLKWVAAR
jgi:murein hydrolase activator